MSFITIVSGYRGSSEADFDGGCLRQYRLGNFGGIFLAASQRRVDLAVSTHDIPYLNKRYIFIPDNVGGMYNIIYIAY